MNKQEVLESCIEQIEQGANRMSVDDLEIEEIEPDGTIIYRLVVVAHERFQEEW